MQHAVGRTRCWRTVLDDYVHQGGQLGQRGVYNGGDAWGYLVFISFSMASQTSTLGACQVATKGILGKLAGEETRDGMVLLDRVGGP